MLKGSVTAALSLLLLLLSAQSQQSAATLSERLILRRQTESEQETTTAKNQGQQPPQAPVAPNNGNNNHNGGGAQQPPRLYPDLAHVSGGGAYAPFPPPPLVPQQLPPGAVVAPYGPHYPPNHGPTPFVPFGMQLPTNRLNDLQRRLQPRPVPSPSERLQSETFTHGLGRRLLSMMGLDMSPQTNETNSVEAGAEMNQQPATSANSRFALDGTMKALQNATVLQQLNKGVQSIYGGLSKMYNSTVQQQLNLLQERFKKETENSTSPWQQRMAQQVPMFFKSMATKVEEAQSNLNRIWHQVSQASNGSIDRNMMDTNNGNPQFGSRLQPASFAFGPGQMGDDGLQPVGGGGNFFNQLGRQFGFGGPPNGDPQQAGAGADIGAQLMNFWHSQVQPQIGMVRRQVSRVWRDLTASGAYQMDPMIRSRQNNNNLGASAPKNESSDSASSDIVDDILKSVDLGNSEYTLVEPQSSTSADQPQKQQPQSNSKANELSAQFQNRLVAMQRELNQLWSGLSGSIQGALGNVKSALNPMPQQFNPLEPMASDMSGQAVDPAQNEIDGKIKDLSKLQRDADIVYDTVQKQQQAQQRPSFTDRFRNFIGNVDFGNVDQLSDRIGESVSRFGSAVGDLWHQIPTRWENFMQNVRQSGDQTNATNGRLTLPTAGTAQKPVSTQSP